tara:strand:+ start:300 stop:455 length:156 start_codon:yes stop_codon:yes gene_type:complete
MLQAARSLVVIETGGKDQAIDAWRDSAFRPSRQIVASSMALHNTASRFLVN